MPWPEKPRTALVIIPPLPEAVEALRTATKNLDDATVELAATYKAWCEAGSVHTEAEGRYNKAVKLVLAAALGKPEET